MIHFPITSSNPIQLVDNDGRFYHYRSPGSSSMNLIAPMNGFVYLYRYKSNLTIHKVSSLPALESDTEGWYIGFAPLSNSEYPVIENRVLPTSNAFAFYQPEMRATHDRGPKTVARTLFTEYKRLNPGSNEVNIVSRDDVTGAIVEHTTFLLETSTVSLVDRAELFSTSYWERDNPDLVYFPVNAGQLIWNIDSGEREIYISQTYIKGRNESVDYSVVRVTARFYLDVSHYYQLLINNNQVNGNIMNLPFIRETGVDLERTNNSLLKVVYEDARWPKRKDDLVVGLIINIQGCFQKIDLQLENWTKSFDVHVPPEIALIGINEVVSGVYAYARYSQADRIPNEGYRAVSPNQLITINRDNLGTGSDIIIPKFFSYEIDQETFSNGIQIMASRSIMMSLNEKAREILNSKYIYYAWLDGRHAENTYKNEVLLSLYQQINVLTNDPAIDESDRTRLLSHVNTGTNSEYRRIQARIRRFETEFQRVINEVRSFLSNPDAILLLSEEFRLNEDNDFYVSALESLYDALDGTTYGEQILEMLSNHFLSQTEVDVDVPRGLTASHFYLIWKRSLKLSRVCMKVFFFNVRTDVIKRLANSNLSEIRQLTAYRRLFNGMDLEVINSPSGNSLALKHSARLAFQAHTSGIMRIHSILQIIDAMNAFWSFIIKTKDIYNNPSNSDYIPLLAAGSSFAAKLRLLFSSEDLLANNRLLRFNPAQLTKFASMTSALYTMISASNAARRLRARGNETAATFQGAAAIGAFVMGAGEFVSFTGLCAPLGVGLIVLGLGLNLIAEIVGSSYSRSYLEDYIRFGYYKIVDKPRC